MFNKIINYIMLKTNPVINTDCEWCHGKMRRVEPKDVSMTDRKKLKSKNKFSQVVEKGWICKNECQGKKIIIK